MSIIKIKGKYPSRRGRYYLEQNTVNPILDEQESEYQYRMARVLEEDIPITDELISRILLLIDLTICHPNNK